MSRSHKPTIGLYPGPDISPTRIMDALEGSAREQFDVVRLPGHGEEGHGDIVQRYGAAMRTWTAFLFGLSHSHASSAHNPHQIAAIGHLLSASKVPPSIICMEDVPHVGFQYQDIRHLAPFMTIFTAAKGYEEQLQEYGWGDIRHVGPPPHWGAMAENLREGEAMREGRVLRRRLYGTVGKGETLPEGQRVVYITGYKRPTAEVALITEAREALDHLFGVWQYVLHYRRDPREAQLFPAEELAQLDAARERALAGTWELANGAFHTEDPVEKRKVNERLTGAADIVVTHPGSSLLHIIAAVRKTAITSMAYVWENDGGTGFDYAYWGNRCTALTHEAHELRHVLRHLLLEDGEGALHEKQAQNYSELSLDGSEARKAVKEVARMVRKT